MTSTQGSFYSYPSTLNVGNFVTVKLDHTNYLIWKSQLETLIESRDMDGFLDGSFCKPQPTISVGGTAAGELKEIPNPRFVAWKRSDHLLKGWINSSNEVLGLIVGLDTAADVWKALENAFAQDSKERVLLTQQMKSIEKGMDSLHEYIQKFKSLCDDLVAIGKAVTDDYKVFWLLQGLGQGYETFVTTMLKPPVPSYSEIVPMLQSHETCTLRHGSSGLGTMAHHGDIDPHGSNSPSMSTLDPSSSLEDNGGPSSIPAVPLPLHEGPIESVGSNLTTSSNSVDDLSTIADHLSPDQHVQPRQTNPSPPPSSNCNSLPEDLPDSIPSLIGSPGKPSTVGPGPAPTVASNQILTRSQHEIFKPNRRYTSFITTSNSIPTEPKTVKSALKHPGGVMDSQAIQDESEEVWSRPNWPPSLERIFADVLVDEMNYVIVLVGEFDEKAWDHACKEFNEETSLNFSKEELKKHAGILRKRYRIVKPLYDHGGFGWDYMRKMVDVDDVVWEEYIEVHPKIKPYRKWGCPIYEQLCTMFTKSRATGQYACAIGGFSARPKAAHTAVGPVAVASHSGASLSTSDGPNKRQSATPLSSGHNKRNQKECENAKAEALLQKGSALAQKGDQFSMMNCVTIINEMQGVNRRLYYATMDLFQNVKWRETFISLKKEKRLKWLQAMLPLA
ncbi:hypothetical protein HHK36_023012 [Tetracentron sinense]|uniref:Myb/SANT-like domain-containing protein n=1 Tax=Tetracentron sinense TaxID=13715 RepID=A0A834YU67_TETSI|nr:hypothetical protein HHK36_023012 [Tetracentron sinense]